MLKLFRMLVSPKNLLLVILLLALMLRLYKIDSPIADWHSWRQADTAAVARNFYKEGFNPFLPKYDDMSGVSEAGGPNPIRYRFVEFPIYPSLVYLGYLVRGGVDERIARIVNIFFSLGSLVFVYLITKKYLGQFEALVAALLFALLPFNIFYSRVILPEPSLVFFSLGMFWFVSEAKLSLGIFFTTAALLTKPTAVLYLFPLMFSWPFNRRQTLIYLLSFLPFIFWRVWISLHPEGIPASNWLFNGDHIRFKPAFWRWIISERLGREILGVTGTLLMMVGLLVKPRFKESWMAHLLFLSSFLYLIIIASGNVRHDYYQVLIIPALVIMVARGFTILISGTANFLPRIWTIPLAILFLLLTPYLTWQEVKELYKVNNPKIIEAGKVADKLLPRDAKVVAPYNGDTAFLYQTNRPGFPHVAYSLDELRDWFGVNYYVSVNFDNKTNHVIRKYKVLLKTQDFLIADLTKINSGHDDKQDPEPRR